MFLQEQKRNNTDVAATNMMDEETNSGHDGDHQASNDIPSVGADNQTHTNEEEENHNTHLFKIEPDIVPHFDHSPVSSCLQSALSSDDDHSTPLTADMTGNEIPRCPYRNSYSHFSELEEKYRSQLRSSPSRMHRIEFLHNNK